MNKVDQMVKRLLMAYPTLFKNRFDALGEILTNSTYEWHNGEIIELNQPNPTRQTMLARFEKDLAEKLEEYGNPEEYMRPLYQQFILDAKRNLADATFIADNIDTYATTYAGCGYNVIWAFLHRIERFGISEYWIVNHKPDTIDPEWQEAIYKWFHQLLPCVNNLFGMYNDEERRWMPALPRYEPIVTWAYSTWKAYQSPKQHEAAVQMTQLVTELLADADA